MTNGIIELTSLTDMATRKISLAGKYTGIDVEVVYVGPLEKC